MKATLTTEEFDILYIVEIKPKAGRIPEKELLNLPGYDLFINDAYTDPDTRGVAIYTKHYLNAVPIETTETKSFKDSVWINVPGQNNDNLLTGCVYRSGSPDKAVTLDPELHNMIKEMTLNAGFKRVLVAGDFNHPKILWTPSPVVSCKHISENHPDVKFVNLINEAMLHQHVMQPTRDRENQQSTLDDLILTSDLDMVDDIEHAGHLGASDHQCLKFNIYNTFTKFKPKQQVRFKYHKADFEKINRDLNIDWDAALEGKSADEAYNHFLNLYKETCQKHVPTETTTTSDKFTKPIWMKPATQRLIQRKHRAHTKLLNTKSETDRAAYKVARNKVTSGTRADRLAFERNICKEIKNNNKIFWRYVNSSRLTRAAIPDLEDKDGVKVSDDKGKAELLNHQFSSVFTKEDTSNIPTQAEIPLTSFLSDLTITPEMMKKKLDKLRTDKSCGPDGVHPLVLKKLSPTLSKPLSKIFNISLTTGTVPTIWKQGTVTAIFKKGKKSLPGNYRAITLTSIVCKLLENFITEFIAKHLARNGALDKAQHGFTPHKSTVTNLIEALNIWTEALAHNLPVDIIYLDFEKAFDKVPHERLLHQLHRHGIRGNLLEWIRSYLHNRTQQVRVNGEFSATAPVLSGVPQGSVLGPALFLIFVADASAIVQNFVSLYADDTKLFSYIMDAAGALEYTATSLQLDLNALAVWCDLMQMSYNIDKCHSLHLGKRNQRYNYSLPKMTNIKHSANSISYDYTFHELQKVTEEKDLGVIVDENLNFRKHISGKIAKANSLVFLIKHTFKHLNADMFKMLFKSLVRPHLEYASTVWSPYYKTDIENLEKVQRRATKFITEISELPYRDRLQYLDLPTLQYRRLRQDLLFIYKYINDLLSLDTQTHCKSCIHSTSMFMPSNSQNTRGHNQKLQIVHHLGVRNKFLTTRAIPFWNNLSPKTVNSTSINIFKNSLKSDLSMPNKFDFYNSASGPVHCGR